MTQLQQERARAYEVGMLHGIGGRYDCRPFGNDFDLFTRYDQGRHDGMILAGMPVGKDAR